MKVRLYEFTTGIETAIQPDAGSPTLANDLVTLSYAQANFISGVEAQEVPSGAINDVNTAFTLANTPSSDSSVKLYQNGLLLRQGTDYTISGLNITMTTAPATGQTLDCNYRY